MNEELIQLHEAAKLLGMPAGRLLSYLDTGMLDWVPPTGEDKISRLRRSDVERVRAMYSKAPDGYVTKGEAQKLLHAKTIRKIRSRKVGRLRIYKKTDLEPYLPPDWVTHDLIMSGETKDAISLTGN